MKRNILSEILLYRYRYIVGYLVFALVLAGSLYISFHIPGQITGAEKQSAVYSATISLSDPTVKNIIDLPYHYLQKASLHYFGITNLGIKLPSLIIGALSAIGLLWLLRRWLLRDSIALFTICIFVVTQQFMFASQNGTALIMMMFWLIYILLFALKFTANNKSIVWSFLLCVSLTLSLYTPLSLYIVICLLAASILHPHLRYVVKTIPKLNLILCSLVAAVLIAPLVFSIWKLPEILSILAGWPDATMTLEMLRQNIKTLIISLFFFWQPQLGSIGLTPIFGAASFVLIILGVLNLMRDHHSARSYMLMMTLPVLALPSLFHTEYLIILSVPLVLLMGLGIETLMEEWYSIFPHNPYARITALVPMIILLGGIMVGNLAYYIDAYRYSPNLAKYYDRDLDLVRQELKKRPNATLVVTEKDQPFFNLLKRDFPNIYVSSSLIDGEKTADVIVYKQPSIDQFGTLQSMVVDHYKDTGVRFYIYQK